MNAEASFVIVDEVAPADQDALQLFSVTLGGQPHAVCAHINKHVPELIPGLVTIAINGNHSSVAIFCSTQRQIEKARKEGRL